MAKSKKKSKQRIYGRRQLLKALNEKGKLLSSKLTPVVAGTNRWIRYYELNGKIYRLSYRQSYKYPGAYELDSIKIVKKIED
jgi:hypothetical protein